MNNETELAMLTALSAAHSDISHWIAFARRQQRELPNCDRLPCGPADKGIESSQRVLSKITDALVMYHKIASKS